MQTNETGKYFIRIKRFNTPPFMAFKKGIFAGLKPEKMQDL
jgi:hypothetical protein